MHRLAILIALAAGPAFADVGGPLRLLNWIDYIDPGVVRQFEEETGIEVVLDGYDKGATAEARLVAGDPEIDLAIVSVEYLDRLVALGAIAPVDAARLPGLSNLDRGIDGRLPPGAARMAVPYLWGTTGIGYDVAEVARRLPGVDPATWSLVFDPDLVRQLEGCGVVVVDSPEEVLGIALLWLGRAPDSRDPDDIDAALTAIRRAAPYWRSIDNEGSGDLALGEACLVLGWGGDILASAIEAAETVEIDYVLPVEGAELWIDAFVIPVNAGNVDAAHRFIDFMLRPETIAATTNYTMTANANLLAGPFVDPETLADPRIHPADRTALHTIRGRPAAEKAALMSEWLEIRLLTE